MLRPATCPQEASYWGTPEPSNNCQLGLSQLLCAQVLYPLLCKVDRQQRHQLEPHLLNPAVCKFLQSEWQPASNQGVTATQEKQRPHGPQVLLRATQGQR